MIRLSFPLLLLAACGTPTSTDEDTGGGDTADTDTGADTGDTDTGETGDTGVDPTKATLSGTITLPDGSPAENFRVNVCKSICITVRTGADGTYSATGLLAGAASVYVEATGASSYAVPYVPAVFAEGEAKVIDLKIIEANGSVDLTDGASHALGESPFVLQADDSSYQTALKEPISTLTWGSTDDPASYGPVAFEGETLVFVAYVAPFEGVGAGTLTMNSVGAPTGTTFNVYYGDLPTGSASWELAGSFVAIEGMDTYQGIASLPVLTAVAVTRVDPKP